MSRSINVVLLALAWIVLPAVQAGAQERAAKAAGAYERLDQGRLADELAHMGMQEMERQLVADFEKDGSVASQAVAAQGKIGLARMEVENLDLRDALLDQAARILLKVIAQTGTPKTPEDVITNFRFRFLYADLTGRLQCRLHADELMMLMGGQEDRELIAQYTAKVLKPGSGDNKRAMLDALQDAIESKLEGWRTEDMTTYVLNGPKLERLQEELRYEAAWIRLFRGMAVDDRRERVRLLNEAIQAAAKYAEGHTEDQAKDPSMLLLSGVASMELGLTPASSDPTAGDSDFKRANEFFRQGLSLKNVEAPLQIQLRFELARNLIEWGHFAEAKQEIDGFAAKVSEVVGAGGEIQADVNTTLLTNYLYDKWSKVDKAQKAKYEAMAQDALLKFLKKYESNESVKIVFFKVIANKCRDKDPSTLSPIIQFAIAMDETAIGNEAEKRNDAAAAKAAFTKAAELFKRVLDNPSPEAQAFHDQARTSNGIVLIKLGQGLDAARRLAGSSKYEDVYNACVAYKRMIEESSPAANITQVRKEFVGVLNKLLGKPEWLAKPQVPPWYADQAEQYYRLADRVPMDQDGVNYLSQAVQAYRNVPQTDATTWLDAQYLAIDTEYRLLDALKTLGATSKDELVRRADHLLQQARQYVGLVNGKAKATSDKAAVLRLKEWGASAEFVSAQILYELLDKQVEASQVLHDLPERWPDAGVLVRAKEYEVRKMIEKEDTDAAIKAITDMTAKHPEQANELMRLVIDQIQGRIERLRVGGDAGELKKIRLAYLKFAKALLDKERTAEGKYPYEQMYADAQLENGQVAEAMKAFEALDAAEQSKRSARQGEIDAKIGKLLDELDRVKDSPGDVTRLAEGFVPLVKSGGVDPNRAGYVKALAMSLSYLKELDPAKANANDVNFRASQVAKRLQEGYNGLRKDLKNLISRDPVNIRGLARAYLAKKNFAKATDYFLMLVNGIDPSAYRRQWWQAQLEYCQCLLDVAKADKDPKSALRKLDIRVKALIARDTSKDCGGLSDAFGKLQASIGEALK